MGGWYLLNCLGCSRSHRSKVNECPSLEFYYDREEYNSMLSIGLPGGGLLWGIVTLFFGIIVMIFPRILNYLIGIYLIIMGIMSIIAAL